MDGEQESVNDSWAIEFLCIHQERNLKHLKLHFGGTFQINSSSGKISNLHAPRVKVCLVKMLKFKV